MDESLLTTVGTSPFVLFIFGFSFFEVLQRLSEGKKNGRRGGHREHKESI